MPTPSAVPSRERATFADPRDLDAFLAELGRFERGEIDAEAWRQFRLLSGTYGQRQAGDLHMQRVKIPQGVLSAAQAEALAEVAEVHSRGFGHVTTRQNVQLHYITLASLPDGPVSITDPKVMLPPKEQVYNSIEGLMNHFKLIMEGIHVPPGEVYQAVEGGNGELGFYVVSDGSGRPYRVRVGPPCFMGMGALNKMLVGRMIADIITTFGMINMIGGECDR